MRQSTIPSITTIFSAYTIKKLFRRQNVLLSQNDSLGNIAGINWPGMRHSILIVGGTSTTIPKNIFSILKHSVSNPFIQVFAMKSINLLRFRLRLK